MAQPAYIVAQHSYARCLREPSFFSSFYERLLESHPAVPPMFEHTEFPRQHRLLQHGLGLLLSYARSPDDELLERIAARHSHRGLDVSPDMYPYFLDSLIETVREHDKRFDEEVEAAWRETVAPGIDFMKARYDP